jgi:DNA polymerase-3 subunit beta
MSDNLPATRGESAVATAEPSLPPATVTETPPPAVSGVKLGPSPLIKPKRGVPAKAEKAAPPALAAGEIPRKDLHQALKFLARIAEKRQTLPILTDVLFEDGALLATDLDIGLRVFIPEVKPLAAAVPTKLLRDCVGRGKSPGVTIRSANHEKVPFNVVVDDAVVIGHDGKEFPSIPMLDGMKGSAKVAELPSLEPILPAVCVDGTRINLSGVYLRFCRNMAVATDGHRPHRMRTLGATIEGDFLIPKKVVELIDDIAAATKSPAFGHFYKDACSFRSGNYEVTSRYIEGTFPDYDQVIPKESPHNIEVDRAAIIEALTASLPFSTERANGVKLELKKDKLTLSKQHPDLGTFTRTFPCYRAKGVELGDTSIGLNANYFLDALRFVKDQTVAIQMNDDANPMVIETHDKSLLFVVMPMRL